MAQVLANRCWSFAVRHHGPPAVYVGLFSSSQEKHSWAVARIEAHWKQLLMLEQRRFASKHAMQLWSDLLAARNNAVRLMYCAFERDQCKENSLQGGELLRAMLDTLPDNKIVEDGHGSIRTNATRSGGHTKQTSTRMQGALIAQGLLETRGIPHFAAISKAICVSNIQTLLLRLKAFDTNHKHTNSNKNGLTSWGRNDGKQSRHQL